MAIVVTNAFVDLVSQSPVTIVKNAHELVATDDVPLEPPIWDRLGLGLATGFASGLGAVVLKQLFPNGSAPDLAEIAHSMHDVVRHELEADVISEVQPQLDGVISFMTVDYPNLGGTPEERDPELAIYVSKMEADILPLLDLHKGFTAYVVAAGIHLAIVQERAKLLPVQKERVEAVRQYVSIHSDHILTTMMAIDDNRLYEIKSPEHEKGLYPSSYGVFYDKWPKAKQQEWTFNDNRKYHGRGARTECFRVYDKHMETVENQLDQEVQFEDVRAIVQKWSSWNPDWANMA